VYAVPTDVPLAREISKAKIGIVWHTKYTGNSFESMKASFGENIADSLTQSSAVWSVDAEYKDVSGSATLTKKKTKEITDILSNAGKTFNKIDAAGLNGISDNPELLQRMKTFLNTKVRAREKVTDIPKTVDEMVEYFHNIYQIELGKAAELKTEKGRAAKKEKIEGIRKEVMKYFSETNKANLENILLLMNYIVDAKEILITQMNKVKSLDTFLLTDKGFKSTGQEGFVAIDRVGKNAVKLVDRMNFSYANFSPEVKKGWQR